MSSSEPCGCSESLRLRAELAEARRLATSVPLDREKMVALVTALKDYVHYFNLEHDDQWCPQDDTCTCRLTTALSDALDAAVVALAVPGPAGRTALDRARLAAIARLVAAARERETLPAGQLVAEDGDEADAAAIARMYDSDCVDQIAEVLDEGWLP